MKTYPLLLVCMLLTPLITAFTATFGRRKAVVGWKRQAVIYMPDGEVVQDDPDDDWMVGGEEEPRSEILEYLNTPDFRGPLAVLAAAKKNIDISTIVNIQVKAVTLSTIHIEALCASDPENCVNVLVSVDFPAVCENEAQIIENLNVLHQQASAVLEQRKRESEEQEEAAKLEDGGVPSWWVPASEDLVDVYDAVVAIINDWFEDDLRERFVRQKPKVLGESATGIQRAAIVDIGQTGLIVDARTSQTTIKVPIKFPYRAMDVNTLKNVVIDTLVEGLSQGAVPPSYSTRRRPS